jgi:hypothetical protein
MSYNYSDDPMADAFERALIRREQAREFQQKFQQFVQGLHQAAETSIQQYGGNAPEEVKQELIQGYFQLKRIVQEQGYNNSYGSMGKALHELEDCLGKLGGGEAFERLKLFRKVTLDFRDEKLVGETPPLGMISSMEEYLTESHLDSEARFNEFMRHCLGQMQKHVGCRYNSPWSGSGQFDRTDMERLLDKPLSVDAGGAIRTTTRAKLRRHNPAVARLNPRGTGSLLLRRQRSDPWQRRRKRRLVFMLPSTDVSPLRINLS